MISERLSGILLHVTSLPSYGGIGDFGPAAYGFVDFIASARQRLWQVLPLNPVGYGNSPYSALSAYAGNPLLISLEKLQQDGWLYAGEIDGLAGHNGKVDFGRATSAFNGRSSAAAKGRTGRDRSDRTVSRTGLGPTHKGSADEIASKPP